MTEYLNIVKGTKKRTFHYSVFLEKSEIEKYLKFQFGRIHFAQWKFETPNGRKENLQNEKRYLQNEVKRNQGNESKKKETETQLFELTTNAINKLKEINLKYKNSKVLKINIEAGGCSGFQYTFSLVDKKEIDKEEIVIGYDKECKIIINKVTVDILKNSKVDYVKDLLGNRFVIENIPNISTKCSCGNSFDLNMN